MESNPTLNTKTSEPGTTNNNIKSKAQYCSSSNYLNQINNSAVDYRYDEESHNNNNLNKLQEPARTEVHRLFEPFSLQPADIEDSMSKTDNREPSPSSFDLDTIIKKYGDNSELLQLILSSKVEEDRRRAEEAKLKQKELDYLVSDKEHINSNVTCKTCSHGEDPIVDDTTEYSKEAIVLDKGKEKEDDPHTAFDHFYLKPKSIKDELQLNKENNIKRKIRDDDNEQQILYSSQVSNNKDEDYFSSSSASSYFSPDYYDANGVQTKRHSSLNQLFSSSLSTVSPSESTSSTPAEIPARQLQSLDYLNSRRNSFGPFSLYQRSSFTGKYNMVDSIMQLNTLPPISVSFLSHDQQQVGMDPNSSLMSSQQQPPTVTSAPLVHYRSISNNNNNSNGRFHNLPTLDSFEASIMETLPFHNKSDHSSSADENGPSAQLESTRLSGDPFYETDDSLKQIRKRSLQYSNNKVMSFKDRNFINNTATTGSSSNIISNEATTSKKLPLPPKPSINNQGSSDLSSRPRRRRREMQAITMIIETREFPYNDEYVWKNNGNTIHKSSGQKSIYYKCSNSNAGCPVNKTVTFRDNGEYLIKYRGSHLEECSKIKRVVNV